MSQQSRPNDSTPPPPSPNDIAREPMPANFNPFWRFLGLLFLLTVGIGIASAIIGLALSD
ncbi:hypothetical protein DFR26_0832 [Paraperlucidibaca baekdonensis]|uniref:Uncharacterized protein n=1 Tax=Paraperlucidibaca baekdonensis TaxID=748120 RepID=A0A3E0H553_9GAMM|nr:hypothetical protein [Paraperlucidibaca baekdonensis]REH38673.1 hypothetical protein DFR26_0832 [Paraperlucidibaca baekdonensis]